MPEFERSEDGVFLLMFDNHSPISAADIGALLRDLSADYKKVTGGRIVLWRYETGSTFAFFKDALAIAAGVAGSVTDIVVAAQNMAKFVSYLRDYFNPKSTTDLKPQQIAQVTRAATRIAKIASDAGADVEMTYSSDHNAGTELFKFKLSSSQANAISSKPKIKQVSEEYMVDVGYALPSAQLIEGVANQLASAAATSEDAVNNIVSALASIGGDDLLTSLASSLEASGQYEIAQIVRKHIRGTGKDRQMVPIG